MTWTDGFLQLSISDSGPGIPRSSRERIFLPFHREKDASRKRGAGLGLAISAQLVELMGGSLRLEDRPGGGSVFRFAVPATEVGTPADSAGIDEGGGRRVLIVDDSDDILNLYTRLLEKAGFLVDRAADEPEAWRRFEDRRPDLLIVDLYLKEWEGAGLIRRLRGRGYNGGVVAWSASSLRDDKERALKSGADAFLVKPVESPALHATLNEILRRRGGSGD
jgi:CheY-like chemotaxis protein